MHFAAHSLEIERLYSHMTTHDIRSVAVTACNTGEGVSSLATALAQRYLLSGRSTLLVDLNLYRPSLVPLLETHQDEKPEQLFSAPQLMGFDDSNLALTGVAAPSGRSALIKLRSPGLLEQTIANWHQQFEVVILDTSPLNRINANNLPAERAAAACDSSLLVVLSGITSKAQAAEGIDRLQAAGATLGGCVLNDRYNPRLQAELQREIQRLHKYFRWLAEKLRKIVSKNRLLSLDV